VRHVVCPGSFDPPTNGHLDIVERAAGLADRVTVAVGVDTTKKPVFGAEERVEILRQVIAERGLDSVETVAFSGLLVHFCQRIGADAIIKGVRAVSDFDYELGMAQLNRSLTGIETVFVPTSLEVSFLSSTLVRQVASLGGDVSKLVPAVVAQRLAARVHPRDLG
jgi:pantetheine-phosphate adenylyltransferase